jgi:bifunctional non-homologous end joining protein LigD
MAESQAEQITLYYRQGSSDKVYHVVLESFGTGFAVNFAYGRRGSTMTTGTKTARPVDRATAKKLFDKLVKEKTAKGYTPGADGTPYQHTEKADRATGVLPQLLNPIEEREIQGYIASADWWAQEKYNGKHVLIRRMGDAITGINRLGLAIDLPKPIVDYARSLSSQHYLIDGEAVGDVLYAFDLLESARVEFRQQPYATRLRELQRLLGTDETKSIRVVPTAKTATNKQAMLGTLKGRNREGIVFKRHGAPYTPGRPNSGGDQLKAKFTASCSCIVAGTNGNRRSVKLELLDNAVKRVSVGNVTIPANQEIPAAGQIIEIRYLYAYQGGSLYQPVSLGVRDDLTLADCTLSQLKYRADNTTDDDN